MINIPERLKKFRFIITSGKIPIEKNWQIDKNYSYEDEEFKNHLKKAETYGVLCGFDGLIVVDLDSEEVQQKIQKLNVFPETFTVKSASRGLNHYYYKTDDPQSFKILDEKKNSLMDIQGTGKQIIGAGSKINEKEYQVITDKEIAFIEIAKLKAIIQMSILESEKISFPASRNESFNINKIQDPIVERIKKVITVPDLLRNAGISLNKNPTDCPLHESTKGKCLSFKDDLWFCFHCQAGGDIFSLVQKIENCNFVEAKQKLAKLANIDIEMIKKGKIVLNNPLDSINLKQFIIYKSLDETVYKLMIDDFYIMLNPNEILNSNIFRTKYFTETAILLSSIPAKDWIKKVNEWTHTKGMTIDNVEEANTEIALRENILREIQSFAVTNKPLDAIMYGRLLYLKDRFAHNILIYKKHIEDMIKKNNYKITPNRLKILLDNYMAGKSEVIRTTKSTTHRFYRMKKDMLPDLEIEEEILNNDPEKVL